MEPGSPGGKLSKAQVSDEGVHITCRNCFARKAGDGCRRGVHARGGPAAGAAEAVGEGLGAAGDTAPGALHQCVAHRCWWGGQPGRPLVVESAAHEAAGHVDRPGKPGGEGVDEVVRAHATREPFGGPFLQDFAVVGREGQSGVDAPELGQREICGRGARGVRRRGRGRGRFAGRYGVGDGRRGCDRPCHLGHGLRNRGVLCSEVGGPPLVVVGGAGPEGPEDPADLVARADQTSYPSQMTGHRQGSQRGADCLLPVEGELLGEGLHVHRRTLGQVVDEGGDVPLPLGEQCEVVGAARRGAWPGVERLP